MTKKQALIQKIAKHRVSTTPHKDIKMHIKALNMMSTRELEMIANKI